MKNDRRPVSKLYLTRFWIGSFFTYNIYNKIIWFDFLGEKNTNVLEKKNTKTVKNDFLAQNPKLNLSLNIKWQLVLFQWPIFFFFLCEKICLCSVCIFHKTEYNVVRLLSDVLKREKIRCVPHWYRCNGGWRGWGDKASKIWFDSSHNNIWQAEVQSILRHFNI